jgi:hypothetical protein
VGARGSEQRRGSYRVASSGDPERVGQCLGQDEVVSAGDGMGPLMRAARDG